MNETTVQLNIDCGSSTSYTDSDGLKWVPDDPYISTGEPRAIQTSDSIPERYKTLRLFPSRTKNCYTIPTESGEPRQILVRASFNYGNFDGRSTPPKFELVFDGDDWGSVETGMDRNVFVEVVYVVNGECCYMLGQISLAHFLPLIFSRPPFVFLSLGQQYPSPIFSSSSGRLHPSSIPPFQSRRLHPLSQ